MRLPLGAFVVVVVVAISIAAAGAPASRMASTGAPSSIAFLPAAASSPSARRRHVAAASAAGPVPRDLEGPFAEAPWRTGLEPAEDCGLLEAPTVEVRD
jgi:hypothetical protein